MGIGKHLKINLKKTYFLALNCLDSFSKVFFKSWWISFKNIITSQ